jgi:Flp pilus assembly pilin Flp
MPAEFRLVKQLFQYAALRREALRHRKDNSWGASAIEWAVISAIVVAAAVLIGTTISKLVSNKKDEMCNESDGGC